jgi:hypothetical protein
MIKSILLTIAPLGFIVSVYAASPSPKAPSHHHRMHHKKSAVRGANPSPSTTPKPILKEPLPAANPSPSATPKAILKELLPA